MEKIRKLLNNLKQLRTDRERIISELKETKSILMLKDKIYLTIKERIEELKDKDFNKAFEIWLKYSDKIKSFTMESFIVNGRDIWS